MSIELGTGGIIYLVGLSIVTPLFVWFGVFGKRSLPKIPGGIMAKLPKGKIPHPKHCCSDCGIHHEHYCKVFKTDCTQKKDDHHNEKLPMGFGSSPKKMGRRTRTHYAKTSHGTLPRGFGTKETKE